MVIDPPCDSVGAECGALQMACPERDEGRITASARPERMDRRVNIITPKVLRTRRPRNSRQPCSQSTEQREGSRLALGYNPSGTNPSGTNPPGTNPSAGRGTRTPKGRSPPDFELSLGLCQPYANRCISLYSTRVFGQNQLRAGQVSLGGLPTLLQTYLSKTCPASASLNR